MNIEWNAKKYTDDFSFVSQYGEDLSALIQKPIGVEKPLVCDIGCGNGALTQRLCDMGFSVIGVDDSAQMLEEAEKFHLGIDFRKGNAVDFTLDEKADVIFSNAVFHWIDESQQEKMLCNLASRLKPGGQLVCEFGGKGCAQSVHSTLEKLFEKRGYKYPRTFYFPTIGEYAPLLEKCGFSVRYACLFDRPTPQKGERGLADWIDMFIKKPFEKIDAKEKASIIREAEEILEPLLLIDGKWVIDYVRIRIMAVML